MKHNTAITECRFEAFVPTTDNWFPNYDNDTVRTTVRLLRRCAKADAEVWVTVSGDDDYGMSLEFKGCWADCKDVYNDWVSFFQSRPSIQKKDCLARGMEVW